MLERGLDEGLDEGVLEVYGWLKAGGEDGVR